MTSYLPQTYRLSILIDNQSLFINSWLIRLSVDNVLLINTPRLSILIDKTIPLSIGTSSSHRAVAVGGELLRKKNVRKKKSMQAMHLEFIQNLKMNEEGHEVQEVMMAVSACIAGT
jgi:hypothetical protein